MEIKLRVVEVTLRDGTVITVHEPRMQDLSLYLRSLPALSALGRALAKLDLSEAGIEGVPVDISDRVLEGIYPLFAVMSNITVEEYKNMPVMDGLGILTAFISFLPKAKAETTSPS